MELTYTKVGDYYIPDLALDDGAEHEIGIYGRMRDRFLKEHHPGTYASLILTGKLWKHLAEIDAICHERMDVLISVMAKQEYVTETLKATDQMEWVGRMNNIRNRADTPARMRGKERPPGAKKPRRKACSTGRESGPSGAWGR